jgi:Uma2 family endonuclease
MGIDCGTPEDTSMEASAPALVLEVSSPTTRAIDLNEKLEEYRTVPTLEYIVLVDADIRLSAFTAARQTVAGLAKNWLGWTRPSICRCSIFACRSLTCMQA